MPFFSPYRVYSSGCRDCKTHKAYLMKISKIAISLVDAEESFLAGCFGILLLVYLSWYVNRKLFDVGH